MQLAIFLYTIILKYNMMIKYWKKINKIAQICHYSKEISRYNKMQQNKLILKSINAIILQESMVHIFLKSNQ